MGLARISEILDFVQIVFDIRSKKIKYAERKRRIAKSDILQDCV